MSFEKWLIYSDKIFSMVKKTDTKYVVVPSGAKHYFGEIYERNRIFPYEETYFENEKVFIPSDFDYYLKSRYGEDYMKPPEDNRKERHVYIKFDIEKKEND